MRRGQTVQTRGVALEQHYSPALAAARLGISERAFFRILKRGEIARVVKIGRSTRIPASALDGWLRTRIVS